MTLTFVCQACDDSFELEYGQLTEESRGLTCPNCGKKLPATATEDLVNALDELLGQVAAIRKRFLVSFDVDAEDLPPPWDEEEGKRTREEEEDEEEDEDLDEDVDEEPYSEDEDEDEDRY